MIYSYVSVKNVIAKVFSDLDLQESPHRISDMIEYSSEALKKIGSFSQMVTKTMGKEGIPLMQLVDHQVRLPYDLHSINQVAYSKSLDGPFYDMRYNTGSFGANHELSTAMPDLLVSDQDNNEYQPATENGTVFTNNYTYTITGGYLKSNTRSGYIMLSYQAIPVDEDGYPMVPNDESFLEALYWYINMKLSYPEWKAGRIRDAVYYDAKSSWNYYRKQAYGNAMMPDEAQLESIKNVWLRLIPEINANKNFFSTLGQQEYVYNQNRK